MNRKKLAFCIITFILFCFVTVAYNNLLSNGKMKTFIFGSNSRESNSKKSSNISNQKDVNKIQSKKVEQNKNENNKKLSNQKNSDKQNHIALEAVKHAEKTLNKNDVENAKKLAEEISKQKEKNDLNNRLSQVDKKIQIEKILANLNDNISSATDRKDILDTINYRNSSKIEKIINEVKNINLKKKYINILNKIDETLNDETLDFSSIPNGTATNADSVEIKSNEKIFAIVNGIKAKSLIFSKEGNYLISLRDKAFNSVLLTFTIDRTAPELSINGDSNIKLEAGIDKYNEQGATMTDIVDGTKTIEPEFIHYSVNGKFKSNVKNVDTTKPGLYKIVYKYTDKANNEGLDKNRKDHNYVMRLVTIQDTTAPELSLNGDSNIKLEAGIDKYNEQGATMTDIVDGTKTLEPEFIHYSVNGMFKSTVKNVDTTKPGLYKIVYKYTDKANNEGIDKNRKDHNYVMRLVIVQDTISPELSLNGANNITLEAGDNVYQELGATMTDIVDGTIILSPSYVNYSKDGVYKETMSQVDSKKPGLYKVVYKYKDSSNNEGLDKNRKDHSYVMRLVTIKDTTSPKLHLNGNSNITLTSGIDSYNEQGATMTDNVDKDLTLQPILINYSINGVFKGTVNEVDTTKPGLYKITYKYKDSSNNEGVDVNRNDHKYVMRTVKVVEK